VLLRDQRIKEWTVQDSDDNCIGDAPGWMWSAMIALLGVNGCIALF
jgi:hypothetical protein